MSTIQTLEQALNTLIEQRRHLIRERDEARKETATVLRQLADITEGPASLEAQKRELVRRIELLSDRVERIDIDSLLDG